MNKSIALVLLAGIAVTGCGRTVDSGNRGVFTYYGDVDPKAYPEGFYWYNPWSTDIYELSARTVLYNATTETFTQDLQKSRIHYAVRFRPVASFLPSLFRDVGENYADQIIPPVVIAQIKNHFGHTTAPDVVSKRQALAAAIESDIRPLLAKNHIELESFALINTSFEKEYSDAVEAKQVAVQNAEAEVNRTVQIQEQGKQRVISAEAEAKTIKARGDALAQNPALIRYEWVRKWNGAMPATVYCAAATPCVTGGQ